MKLRWWGLVLLLMIVVLLILSYIDKISLTAIVLALLFIYLAYLFFAVKKFFALPSIFRLVWLVLLLMPVLILLFSYLYSVFGIVYAGAENITAELNWKDYIYFSLVVWTTLGFGDFQPTESSRLIAGFEAAFGYLYMGLAVGSIMEFFSRLHRKNDAINDIFHSLESITLAEAKKMYGEQQQEKEQLLSDLRVLKATNSTLRKNRNALKKIRDDK